MAPTARRTPQDRKKKDRRDPFPFEGMDGVEHYLPPMSFGLFRKHRGLIENENELMMTIVEEVADAETLAALDALPLSEAIELLMEWATPGKSDGSSI
jgi:hypothetical protein